MAEKTATERHDIEKLADSFMAAYRLGTCPSIEQFAQQYPALANELRDLLQALVILEQNAPQRDAPQENNSSTISQVFPREIGDYLILRETGRGGMGVVYEAMQQSLGRHVALKVLSAPGLLNPSHLERFRFEARAAARLHHSHIVPVFGVGESDGLHYYAMQFIQGQSLDLVIDALRAIRSNCRTDAAISNDDCTLTYAVADGLLTGRNVLNHAVNSAEVDTAVERSATTSFTQPPNLGSTEFTSSQSGREFYRSVARVGLQVAEALAYAHDEGILHRDIKPSNLLLDAKANVWVTDFGLAKVVDGEGLTQTGDFVGTLRYMAPERLEGWSDRRSDIYSLGATLYELVTLRPFLEGDSGGQLVERILHDRPALPSKFDRAIPRDLETILVKSIAKEPAARYHNAESLVEDLQRFLADRPILARRTTSMERFTRWCRRNPLVAGLTGAVALLLICAIAILAKSNAAIRRESAGRAAALQERGDALNKAREAVDQMLVRVGHDSLFNVPRGDVIRNELLDDAITFYNSLIAIDDADVTLQFGRASAMLKASDACGSLNRNQQAYDFATKGVEIIEQCIRREPDNVSYRQSLAKGLELQGFFCGRLDRASGNAAAFALYRRSLETLEAIEREYPGTLQSTGLILRRLAQGADACGEHEAALEYRKRSILACRVYLKQYPDDDPTWQALGGCLADIASRPDCENREELLQQSIEACVHLCQLFPKSVDGRFKWATAEYALASHYATALRHDEAINMYGQSAERSAAVCGDRPTHLPAWKLMRKSRESGVALLRKLGRSADSGESIDRYRRWLDQFEPSLPEDTTAQAQFYESKILSADLWRSIGRENDAQLVMTSIADHFIQSPSGLVLNDRISQLLTDRAISHRDHNDLDQAAVAFSRAIDCAADQPWAISPRKNVCRKLAESKQLFQRVAELRPAETTLWIGRAQRRAARSEWNDAEQDYNHVIRDRPIEDEHLDYAALLLLRGDRTAYQKFCREMVEKYSPPHDGYSTYCLVKLCNIGPADCVPSSRLLDWAHQAVKADHRAWQVHEQGLAHLRSGQFADAVRYFDESNSLYGTDMDRGGNFFALAIAHHRLGETSEAKLNLDRAREVFRAAQPSNTGAPANVGPAGSWISLNLWSREADACFATTPAGEDSASNPAQGGDKDSTF